MRAPNVIVSVLGIAGFVLGAVLSWRGRHLALRRPDAADDVDDGAGALATSALRTIGVHLLGGVTAGILVAGLGGRFVMRLLAATSGDRAQRRITEADEVVGEITLGGTIGFIVFIGIAAGVLGAFVLLVARRFLPRTAGPAGLALGVVLLGTIGVADPIDPENVDFEILDPKWLAVALVIVTGLLLSTCTAALVAALERRTAAGRLRRTTLVVPVVLLVVPPVAGFAALYVGGRVLLRGRVGRLLARREVALALRGLVVVAVVLGAARVALASTDILG